MTSANKPAKSVAIVFDDLTEFHVMRPVIDEMLKQKLNLDIIVPHDSGYNGLPKHTLQAIRDLGYHPLTDSKPHKTYQILLTPYPVLDIVNRTHFIYHLKYSYGALSTKPDPVYLPEWKVPYDGIFSFNTYEQNLFNAYGVKSYVVPYWRYYNFKKSASKSSSKSAKPTLLLLPTFGSDISSIKHFTKSAIKDLKKHYYIIAKAHHATHFNSDQDNSLEILQSLADQFYDSDTQITDLLKTADLVLSDNSGAIFESICAGIPVALFAKSLNARKLGTIDTPQCKLVQQGILPYTDQPSQILPMLQSIDRYAKKQTKLKSELFLRIHKDSAKDFVNIIKDYLPRDPSQDYQKSLHDLLNEYIKSKSLAIQNQQSEIECQSSTIQSQQTLIEQQVATIKEQDKIIHDLLNSTSWKITKPLRKLKQFNQKERN